MQRQYHEAFKLQEKMNMAYYKKNQQQLEEDRINQAVENYAERPQVLLVMAAWTGLWPCEEADYRA